MRRKLLPPSAPAAGAAPAAGESELQIEWNGFLSLFGNFFERAREEEN